MGFLQLFPRLILRQLAGERVRTLTTIAGIALGIAVVLAIQLSSASALRGFERAVDSLAGRAALEITQAPHGLDERRLPSLLWLQEYGAVTPIIQGEATWRGADGSQDVLTVLGVDILSDLAFRDYAFGQTERGASTATTRDILGLLTDPQSVVLTDQFARAHGLAVGDLVRFGMADGTRELRVRALLKPEGPARASAGAVLLMDIAAAQAALGRLGYIDRLEVRLDDASALPRIEAELTRRLGGDFIVQRPARRGQQVEKMVAAFQANLTALSSIALIVGMFLVYNTVSTSVLNRRQEIGMLRAVGVTRATVFALFLGEALVLALPGCGLGVLLGRWLAEGAVALTAGTVTRMYIAAAAAPTALDAWQVALAFLIGLPLALVAAAAPAWEAARIAPTVAIRQIADVPVVARRLRVVVAIISLGIALWLCTLGPIGGLPLGGYGAAFFIVVGTTAITAPIFLMAARAAAWLFRRLFVLECWLATSNLVEYTRRLSVSVAALAVSLAMTVAIAIMVSSFRETVTYWIDQTLVADLFIAPASRRAGAQEAAVPAEAEAIVRTHPAVAAVDAFRLIPLSYQDAPIFVGSGDFGVLLDRGRLLFKAPSRGAEAMRAAIGQEAAVVSEAFALRHHVRVGDAIALTTLIGARPLRVAAIYYDYSNDRGTVMLDRALFARLFGDRRPSGLTVYLKPEADIDATRAALLRAFGAERGLMVNTNRALRQEVMRIFDSTFAITWALELVAILVAVLGIVATLITVIVERRRELGLLRLVGASRGQVQRMVVAEAAMLGGISQGLGLIVGVALSLVLIYVVNVQSFGWSIQFHLPIAFLAQLTIVLVAATALAGLFPARRAARAYLTERTADE